MERKNEIKKFLTLLLLGIFFISFASANEFAYNTIKTSEGNLTIINNDTITNNNYYSLGVNSTQMENATILNIKESWLTIFWNSVFGTKIGDSWIIKNADNSGYSFNTSNLDTTYYNASLVSTIAGTPQGTGTEINYKYDEISYNVTEVASNPGMDLRINFTGVPTTNELLIKYKTTSSKIAYIQLWSYGKSSWEDFGSLSTSIQFSKKDIGIDDPSDHIQGGILQFRIYIDAIGSPQNKWEFDMITISSGYAPIPGQEIDPYLSNPNRNIQMGGFNITNASWIKATNLNITGKSYLGNFQIQNDLIVGNINISGTNNRIGIGTLSPSSTLEVGKVSGKNEVNLSGVLYVNSTSGKVGIGTDSPASSLHLFKNLADGEALRIDREGNNYLSFIVPSGSPSKSKIKLNGDKDVMYFYHTTLGNYAKGDVQFVNDVYFSEDVGITGNLSLAQKITFSLSETIDNLVDGWIRITGGLNVTQNLEVGGNIDVINNISIDEAVSIGVTQILPICSSTLNGTIMRNATGTYGCSHTSVWTLIF